ncbi:hypothetical protein L226DRAFT_477766 [Lentinus tigrinus ALCF2SS1-7]|uniref:F-box domain-containing protein n=1 Tax=Lentinus tigrinus ALCF2SS1-6 TaxID=1328759 RepID=A0A5C2SWZ7_9APHY|nr:hypothetical protein L227DRAFT_538461 [Lentinus tigrinus ALCF2SS1-6]RPD81300.1 hypothetical protein L226DRAFT_477766 [Lentinus tigrinus ALCF2SS1-7]
MSHTEPVNWSCSSASESNVLLGPWPHATLVLETLPQDVFRLIAIEALLARGTLQRLAQTSCRIREACKPILFARSVVYPDGQKGEPPPGVRTHIRHITYMSYTSLRQERRTCVSGIELDYLPILRSVTFRCPLNVSHLDLMKRCLAHPHLASVTFTKGVRWCGGRPDPRVDSPYPPEISITHLSHAPSAWREISCDLARRNLPTEIALESQCLALITLGINRSVEVLDLPLETAPMARMADLAWPRLQELSLCGRYIFPSQSFSLPHILARAPNLRKLTVQVAQPRALGLVRHGAPILGRNPTSLIDLPDLRSLTLAYPDPDDVIFSTSFTSIIHLSLRDWPRYYYYQDVSPMVNRWGAPLLTASECLGILKRMGLYDLESLELVYRVDHADEALLRCIATYPKLARLELHRYTIAREDVPYINIVNALVTIRSLRELRLHLDFPEATCPRMSYIEFADRHDRWIEAAERRGIEVVDILEPHCPNLEYVGLLNYDASRGSYWWKFRTSKWPGGRVDRERRDTESFESLPSS